MRSIAISITLLVFMGSAARADSATHLRVGVAGQLGARECDHCGGASRGGGPTLRALWDVSPRVRLGAMFEHLWYASDDVELDVTQQALSVLFELRLSPWAAIDVGLGAGRYSGRVDIPETPGCYGCGRYDGTTYNPQLLAGVTFAVPATQRVTIEVSVHGVKAFALARSEDVHDFVPPDTSLRADLGVAVAF